MGSVFITYIFSNVYNCIFNSFGIFSLMEFVPRGFFFLTAYLTFLSFFHYLLDFSYLLDSDKLCVVEPMVGTSELIFPIFIPLASFPSIREEGKVITSLAIALSNSPIVSIPFLASFLPPYSNLDSISPPRSAYL